MKTIRSLFLLIVAALFIAVTTNAANEVLSSDLTQQVAIEQSDTWAPDEGVLCQTDAEEIMVSDAAIPKDGTLVAETTQQFQNNVMTAEMTLKKADVSQSTQVNIDTGNVGSINQFTNSTAMTNVSTEVTMVQAYLRV